MKTKNVKKLALTCFAAAFLACGSIGLVVADFETSAATESIGSFEMVGGASIRTVSGTTGIRYTAKFDEALYNAVAEDEDKEFGMIITKLDYYVQAKAANSDLIAGLDSLGANKYVLISESSANPCTPYLYTLPSGETEYRVSGALTNIKYSNADSTWMGVGVVITGNGDEADTYEYAKTDETNARTTAYVATAALNDEAFGYKDYEKDVMRDYVYEYTAKVSGLDEATFDAQEDKSANLSGLTIALGDGIDTTEKYNQNVAGKETYLTINETETVNIAVTTADGKALDFACETTSSDSEVVKVENFNQLKPLKNGYTTLTVSSTALGDWSETVTAYVGSTDAGNWATAKVKTNEGAEKAVTQNGTIAGMDYSAYTYDRDNKSYLWAAYSDISVYYIDYLLDNGYKYLRIPFYVDTTRYAELGGTAEDVSNPYFTVWMAKGLDGSSGGKFSTVSVPKNEWVYYDMDLMHYRMNFTEADGSKVDTYGQKLKASSYYQYLNMKMCAYGYVYWADMTFIKDSTYTVVGDTTETTATFGDLIDLSTTYTATADIALSYKVNGESQRKILAAVNSENAITVNGNVYTAHIGNGSYAIGDSAAWKINSVDKSEDIAKTLNVTVSDGIKAVNLVDVNGKEAVTMADYNKAADLEALGFTVSQSFEKRYAATDYEQAATIATTERGIFYANVTAEKDGETYTYSTTIDVYNSTEPVEYESFGHDDSAYAVKAYYYLGGSNNTATYDYLKKTYTFEAGTGMEITVDNNYMSVKEFSATDVSNSSVKTAYGDLANSLTGMGYLAIDQSKITPEGPLTAEGFTYGDTNANLYVYVTPRHTKDYYATFAENDTTSVLKYTYAAGWTKAQSKVSGLMSIDQNGVGSMKYYAHESAAWQKYISSFSTITLETIVNNYDRLNSWEIAIWRVQSPHGKSATELNNGTGKLGALLF